MSNVLRRIPSVHELLESPPLQRMVERANRNVVVTGVREFLEKMRHDVQQAGADRGIPTPTELAERIADWISRELRPGLRPVINATGVLLHTGLGRAPMADAAVEALQQAARGYVSLEVDLESGERSQRMQAVDRVLRHVTGAEAVHVVNNNAAATVLALGAVAAGREVIVSRGQLVEIGGSYRLPDVMETSGAILREVGTTNKTRIGDFQDAIRPETGALLRVHCSNFVIHGFTEQPTLAELVALGRRRRLPVIDDIGSGALVDFQVYGIPGEPVAQQSLREGADLVLFSGDKLVGGPQCGILLGRKPLIQKIASHPLARAMRVDRLTLAALAATLELYLDPETLPQTLPLLSLLATSRDNLKNRAERLAPQMADAEAIAAADPVEGTSYLGGGSVPGQEIPTWCIALSPAHGSVDQLARVLRTGATSVFGRVQHDRLLLDLRSVLPCQDATLVAAVQAVGRGGGSPGPPDAGDGAESPETEASGPDTPL